AEFERRMRHERPASLSKALRAHKKALLETPQNVATRKSSESAIEAIASAMPMEFLAGSADLTGSNNNKAKSAVAFSAKTPKGRFIHYGIREHGMAACMNGIFLHGGFAPNGATFLVFTDYARPAMRLAAAQGEATVSLFASGSEVEIAVAAQKQLTERGIPSRVVSVPSLELLLAQPADRRKAVIGNAPVKVAIEAAVRWGWDAVIGQD